MILDYLGIHIKTSGLPSYERKRAAYKKLAGTHAVSRFWAQHVRPHVMPSIQSRIVQEHNAACDAVSGELLNAMLQQAGEVGLTRP